MLKYLGRALIAASLSVAAGVAVNQILNNGKLSWSWGYLALVVTVLGGLVEAAPAASESTPPPHRKGSRRVYLRRMRAAEKPMDTRTPTSTVVRYVIPSSGAAHSPHRELAAAGIRSATALPSGWSGGLYRLHRVLPDRSKENEFLKRQPSVPSGPCSSEPRLTSSLGRSWPTSGAAACC
jgi:hypothetical protein